MLLLIFRDIFILVNIYIYTRGGFSHISNPRIPRTSKNSNNSKFEKNASSNSNIIHKVSLIKTYKLITNKLYSN
jgi:hypothetical protein